MLSPLQPFGKIPGINYGFFNRLGGVSEGEYATLNCRLASTDKIDHIDTNRSRVAAYLGTDASNLLSPAQIHSKNVAVAKSPWLEASQKPEADGLVTNVAGLAISVLTADCGPVIFVDPVNMVIGVAHAGWRGAVSGVLETTIDKMINNGAELSQIQAALGPTISAQYYEVSQEFQDNLCDQSSINNQFFTIHTKTGNPHFDLPAYIITRLQQAGVLRTHNCKQCTYSNESLYYSYRYSQHNHHNDYGCQIAAVMLEA